ncbi:hypothetical protein LCGC14_3064680 [marine sediment metagenome]|uniref:Uncharacterized protein n=1 Tax=marine sediment metagenome TaxID=412755 RepID=A0A0F8Z8M1_9ZZZZ
MEEINMYPIPDGYNHKATSESFSGTEKVVIYHSSTEDRYLIVSCSKLNEGVNEDGVFINKTQLELIVHAGTDVLDMSR